MGSRLLRNNLLAPSKVQATIDARLDAVDELIHNEEMYNAVRESLKPLHKADLDKLLSSLITSQLGRKSTSRASCFSTRVAQMLKIRDFLGCLPAVQSAIRTSSSSLLKLLHKILNDERFNTLQNAVSQTFNEDLPLYKKGNKASLHIYVYAVKASINRLLDVARETFRENIGDVYQLCQDISEKYEIQVQINHHATGNYFFLLKRGTLPNAPPKEFIHVTTKGNKISFSTLELKKKNARIKDALDEIMILSDQIVEKLLYDILEDIGILYKASDDRGVNASLSSDSCQIALLDLLWSFAHASIVHNYVRPEFTGVMAVKGGRHPILDADPTFKTALVSNDAYCCTSTCFQLIQGAKVVDGAPQNLGQYGMALANLADIPHSMFEHAMKASERISLINEEQEQKSGVRRIIDRRKALIQTHSRLQRIAKFSTLTQEDLLAFLQKIQAETVIALETQV
ncbi:hypothetical protein Clacol_003604 [Clathrus columnatus]|uniref:DNA mismatch repair protein MutS core domain-containing protein n=1 Tax=Clathrus columnatus TaxID=1419009 RepID=A0AAV5A6T8_9AGAM|nr:hypothetical protein Clacol_003604 [Clathrus columnatus]